MKHSHCSRDLVGPLADARAAEGRGARRAHAREDGAAGEDRAGTVQSSWSVRLDTVVSDGWEMAEKKKQELWMKLLTVDIRVPLCALFSRRSTESTNHRVETITG